MKIIPKLRIKRGETIGNELFIQFPDLESPLTYLSTDYSSGSTSFLIEDGSRFSGTQYFVFGQPRQGQAELLRSSSVTNTSINTSASSFAHNRGEMVQFIPFNQIEIYHSTDGVVYTLVQTVGIMVDSDETYYNNTTDASGVYYKIRFKNSTDATYSDYSSAIASPAYVPNSAGNIIDTALNALGERIDGLVITKRFLYDALNEARREIDEDENIIRWSFRSVFNYNPYAIIPGQYKIPVPTDLRNPETNKDILAIRVGKRKDKCNYYDQQSFEDSYEGVYHTTLNGAVTHVATSITLSDSGDFNDSGSLIVAGESVTQTIDTPAYTANNLTTNVLTGVTGIKAAGYSTGVDVWQGASFGLPLNYTVNNGYIYFSQPFSNDLAGENVYMDYYKNITDITSDSDVLDEPFWNIYIPYLRFRIRLKKDKSLSTSSKTSAGWKNDLDFIKWTSMKTAQIKKEYMGVNLRISIDC